MPRDFKVTKNDGKGKRERAWLEVYRIRQRKWYMVVQESYTRQGTGHGHGGTDNLVRNVINFSEKIKLKN